MKQEEIDLLVIGAGQAGLAVAYYLQATDLSYVLLDGHERVGDSWRQRYDALTLFTSRSFSTLPGLALSGDPDGYPTRDEIADYFEDYAQYFDFPIHLNQSVWSLKKTKTGFEATTRQGDVYRSRVVIIATGAFQKIHVPRISENFGSDVRQFTAQSYKNPSMIPGGKVLIVGDGASGRDLAQELARTHDVLLATGRSRRLIPESLLGKNIWWWLDQIGLLDAPTDSSIGRMMQKTDPFPARGRRLQTLRRDGVTVLPYLTTATGNTVHFANGHVDQVDVVIWATGYRDESEWVEIPDTKDDKGNFVQHAGISPVDGLYFIGRPWQRTRGSALITGVGDDAQYLVQHIESKSMLASPSVMTKGM